MNSKLQILAENVHVTAQTIEHVRRMTGGDRNSPPVVPEERLMPSPTMCVAITAGGKKARDRQHGKAFVAK